MQLWTHLRLLRLNTCGRLRKPKPVCFSCKRYWLYSLLLSSPLGISQNLLLKLLNVNKSSWNRQSNRLVLLVPHLKNLTCESCCVHKLLLFESSELGHSLTANGIFSVNRYVI